VSVFKSKGHHTYFVYGSNMNPAQLADRCGAAEVLGVARLADHRLAFFGYSAVWDGGEEALVPHIGEEVWGVLYRMSFAAADQLDEWQGVRADGCGSYFLFPVFAVDLHGVSHAALLYRKASCGEPSLPSNAQLAFILAGAVAQRLPPKYIDHLRQVNTKKARYPVPRRESDARLFLSRLCAGCR